MREEDVQATVQIRFDDVIDTPSQRRTLTMTPQAALVVGLVNLLERKVPAGTGLLYLEPAESTPALAQWGEELLATYAFLAEQQLHWPGEVTGELRHHARFVWPGESRAVVHVLQVRRRLVVFVFVDDRETFSASVDAKPQQLYPSMGRISSALTNGVSYSLEWAAAAKAAQLLAQRKARR